MFTVTKTIEIAGAHKLNLSYQSPCSQLHGHNWIVGVTVGAEVLDENGMVVDFKNLNEIIQICHNTLDHKCFNDVLPDMNPTAENIAFWFACTVNRNLVTPNNAKVVSVTVQESTNNVAEWRL